MPYTTQGHMTLEDIRDWEEDTDNGVIHVSLDDLPEWFETPDVCPIDGKPITEHESVTVARAGGEIVDCI